MSSQDLKKKFEAAINKANGQEQSEVPPDLQLHLYAYYKRAIDELHQSPSFEHNDLRSAFKMNALFQVQNISKEEAMRRYIEIIDDLYPEDKHNN